MADDFCEYFERKIHQAVKRNDSPMPLFETDAQNVLMTEKNNKAFEQNNTTCEMMLRTYPLPLHHIQEVNEYEYDSSITNPVAPDGAANQGDRR